MTLAQRNIDFGSFPNDPDADAIRTAFRKTQENFTELYNSLDREGVISVNQTPGDGITVSPTTGNVVVSANIACVAIRSTSLNVRLEGGPPGNIAIVRQSSDVVVVDLPTNLTGLANAAFTGLVTSNNFVANNSVTSPNVSVSNNLTTTNLISTNVNVTNTATIANLIGTTATVTGNLSAGNLSATTLTGNLSATTATITGNLTTGNANLGNTATANFFVGNGSQLTGVLAAPGNLVVNGGSQVFVQLDGPVTTRVGGTNRLVVSSTGTNVTGNGVFSGSITSVNAALGNAATANFFIGNLFGVANSAVTANTATTAGTVTTNAQPNITSVGTLSSLGVNGTITAVNITANTGVFSGNGSGLTALNASNVSTGTIPSARLSGTYTITVDGTATSAGTVTTNAQPNITSVGNLTGLTVTGTATATTFSGSGANLTNLNASNISTGTLSNARLSGTYTINIDGTATSATTAGTVTTTAQPNITSVGTLSNLTVSGTVTAGTFAGDGSLLTNIAVTAGSSILNGNSSVTVDANSNVRISVAGTPNVIVISNTSANINGNAAVTGNLGAGNISATLLTGSITTNAQPNITTIGTLTGLTVNGVSNLGPNANVRITGGVNGAVLSTDGNGNLTWNTASVLPVQGANTQLIFNSNNTTYAGSNNLTFNNVTNVMTVGGNIIATNIFANTGNVVANVLTGTLTTNAQPNVTSVGTLTSLIVNGNINAGNITVPSGVFTGNGSGLTNLNASNLATGTIPSARLSGTYTININGTVTTAAQPNITSVGTLTSLAVSGNITAANINANTGVFSGNGSELTNLNASNISTGTLSNARLSGTYTININGTATSATTAGTVTTAAQPNITSVGMLTGLNVAGNITSENVSASGYLIRSVLTGISAAGTTQSNATALTTEISVVSTVSANQGVRLPTAVAGMVATITNASTTNLRVYPATGASINSLAANAHYDLPSNATIQFIAPTTTQWYTVGATFA